MKFLYAFYILKWKRDFTLLLVTMTFSLKYLPWYMQVFSKRYILKATDSCINAKI